MLEATVGGVVVLVLGAATCADRLGEALDVVLDLGRIGGCSGANHGVAKSQGAVVRKFLERNAEPIGAKTATRLGHPGRAREMHARHGFET